MTSTKEPKLQDIPPGAYLNPPRGPLDQDRPGEGITIEWWTELLDAATPNGPPDDIVAACAYAASR